MKALINTSLLCLIILHLLCNTTLVWAENTLNLENFDLEDLLNIEVVSASKRQQNITESPNAIYVITAEDIKHSGAVYIADLFRMVPGVDVVNAYGSTSGVSARGFNERFARRMLVVIDGRSIYTTFSGGVFWESFHVFLEDIERIEVIRGPGATLWGANAVNGVINIITKDPEKYRETMVTAKAGTQQFRQGVFRYSNSFSNKLSVSITGGYKEHEGSSSANDFYEIPKAMGRIKYRFSDDSVLQLFAGMSDADRGFPLTMFTENVDSVGSSNYQMLKWEKKISNTSRFQLSVYRNYYKFDGEGEAVEIEEEEYALELQHSFALGSMQQIMWGINYYTTEADSNYLSGKNQQDDTISCFLQNDIRLTENLKCVFGLSYEKNSFTGGDFAPRGTMLYSPSKNHHLRFSFAKAFQTPSFAKDSFYLPQTLPEPLPPLVAALVVGNEHLDTEDMTAFEVGYRTVLFEKFCLNVELYYNDIDNVATEIVDRRFVWPIRITWDNVYNAVAKGAEVSIDVPVFPWWNLSANYTYQEVENKRENQDVPGTPRHKINVSSIFSFNNGFSFTVRAHYVDDTTWRPVIGDPVQLDHYLRLDMRISQMLFNNRLEMSLVGQNLTDKTHPETSDGTATYNAERLIYGQVTWHLR